MTIPWIDDPTNSDRRDAAEDTWVVALSQVRDRYPDAELVEVMHNVPGMYCLEAEHEDYLIRFADADCGHLDMSGQIINEWEAVIDDEDGIQVERFTAQRIPELVGQVYPWLLARVDADRVAQADDPDRAHDSKEA